MIFNLKMSTWNAPGVCVWASNGCNATHLQTRNRNEIKQECGGHMSCYDSKIISDVYFLMWKGKGYSLTDDSWLVEHKVSTLAQQHTGQMVFILGTMSLIFILFFDNLI